MKKQLILISASLILFLFTFSSCSDELDYIEERIECKKGTGGIVEESLTLPTFHSIDLQEDIEVFISQGATQEVRVEAQANVISELERRVEGGIWKIEFDDCFRKRSGVKIYITIAELNEINLNSSGKITSQSNFTSSHAIVKSAGSGTLILNGLNAQEVSCSITGSGNIHLSGTAPLYNAYISGSGNIISFGLEATEVDASIIGSGNLETKANNLLDVGITSSGNVYYKGDPATVQTSISGSGKVIKVN